MANAIWVILNQNLARGIYSMIAREEALEDDKSNTKAFKN